MEEVTGQTREAEQRPMYKDPPPVEYCNIYSLMTLHLLIATVKVDFGYRHYTNMRYVLPHILPLTSILVLHQSGLSPQWS